MRILCIAKDSPILSTKNNSVFQVVMFVILMNRKLTALFNFEQLGPGVQVHKQNLKRLHLHGDYDIFLTALYAHMY